jgi:hypothetical protein
MVEKKNIGRFYGVCLATIYATLITVMARGVWHGLHIGLCCYSSAVGPGFILLECGRLQSAELNSTRNYRLAARNSVEEERHFTIGSHREDYVEIQNSTLLEFDSKDRIERPVWQTSLTIRVANRAHKSEG